MQNAQYKSIPVLHEQMSGDGDSFKSLKEVRLKNLNRIVLAHLNINSLRNKFDALVEQVSGNVDVLVLSETKIDESFPEGQFKIPGFCTPFRLDRDSFGGGILVYVQENIPAKLLSSEVKTIEGIFIELISIRTNDFLVVVTTLAEVTS